MRVLVCLDPQPLPDGSCQSSAWVEQPSFADYLPTVEHAGQVGLSFFVSIAALVAFRSLLFPPKEL